MPQIAIYLDKETAEILDTAAEREGKSKSAFVRDAIKVRAQMETASGYLPQWWFDNLGGWEDDRSPEEIMRDIRSGPAQRERAKFS